VLLPSPRPGLRREVEQALEDRAARLVRIAVSTTGDRQRLGDAISGLDLREIAPVEVFLRRWRMDHSDEPPEVVLRAFQTLLAQAEGGA
jgi:exonuclease SbcD